jgi:hypothetical protein
MEELLHLVAPPFPGDFPDQSIRDRECLCDVEVVGGGEGVAGVFGSGDVWVHIPTSSHKAGQEPGVGFLPQPLGRVRKSIARRGEWRLDFAIGGEQFASLGMGSIPAEVR